jgi:hypothetical protein
MRPILVAAALLAAPLAGPAFARPITPAEQTQIDWVVARGRLLFELDRAAWVGTDDMMARIRDYRTAGMRGYFVEREGTALIVTFFGGPADAPVAFYRGRVENRRVASSEVFPANGRPSLTPLQRRLAAAREMTGRLGHAPCGRSPFNTVVVPPDAPDGPIDLYLLTPQPSAGTFPLGGHFKATINADGSVAANRGFTRSCLMMPRPDGAAGLFVSHLLDPVPTEIHVFTSFTAGVPVFVGISGRVFAVNQDQISISDLPAPPPPKT